MGVSNVVVEVVDVVGVSLRDVFAMRWNCNARANLEFVAMVGTEERVCVQGEVAGSTVPFVHCSPKMEINVPVDKQPQTDIPQSGQPH